MTAAGDAVVAAAYTWVGTTEDPPNSNLCSPFTDGWGAGAWCAMFVSYVSAQAGAPVPPINGPLGFSYVPDGQVAAHTTGHSVGEGGAEPGDSLHMSWEPFYYGADGVAYCSYGVYAGSPAGDHTGIFVGWADGGYMVTVEGNTSQSSWDNGGAVMERTDRHTGQICCYARHAALEGGPSTPEPPKGWLDMLTDQQQADLYQMVQSIFWMVGNQNPTAGAETIASKVDEIRGHAQSTYWMVGNQEPAADVETIASNVAATRRAVEGG